VNADIINKFLHATKTVLSEYFSISVISGGAPTTVKGSEALEDISVIIGVTGDMYGQFLIGCTSNTALNIARSMMSSPDYPQFDEMCQSALSELGNMIGGMSATGLAEMGFMCELAPPSIVIATNSAASISTSLMICLPMETSAGEFKTCIGLQSNA